MRKSAAEVIKILHLTKWPDHLLGEAGYMVMRMTEGDTSYLYTLHTGQELAGIFALEVEPENKITKGMLWMPVYSAAAALSRYTEHGDWSGFMMAPPLSRVIDEVRAFTRHYELQQPTQPIRRKPRAISNPLQMYLP